MLKYRNKPVTIDGVRFDSQKEAARFHELKLLERAGEITDLERQVAYDLAVNGVKVARYIADFRFKDKKTGIVVEDVKSEATAKTRDFVIKRKLMRAIHGVEVQVRL